MTDFHLLEKTRLGVLVSSRINGQPIAVPVWFDWDGETLRCFAVKDSAKIERLSRHSWATLLVTNSVGEPESWLAFDGEINIVAVSGFELAKKLAHRYWDLIDSANAQKLAAWKKTPEAFTLLKMRPTQIRNGS